MKTKSKLKKGLILAAVLIVTACAVASLSGCVSVVTNTAVKVEPNKATVGGSSTVESGILTVGVNTKKAVYASKDSSGKLVGYDVDMANALANQMGMQIKIIDVGDDGKKALEEKKVDLVFGLNKSLDDSSTKIFYSNAYLNDGAAMFTLTKNKPQSVADVDYTQGKAIALVGQDTTYTVQKTIGVDNVVICSTMDEVFKALEKNTAQYATVDAVAGMYTACNYDDVSFVNYLSQSNIKPAYIGVHSDKTELQTAVNNALKTISSNGEQLSITNKWLGKDGNLLLPGKTDITKLPRELSKTPSKTS